MRSEQQVNDKIFHYSNILKSKMGLDPYHAAMIRKQIKELKWVLGEGSDINIDEMYRREAEIAKKLEKLLDD